MFELPTILLNTVMVLVASDETRHPTLITEICTIRLSVTHKTLKHMIEARNSDGFRTSVTSPNSANVFESL